MIIYTKLEIPPVKRELLPRDRLINRLSANRDARLISVVAPAGSGKTCLISDWITRDNIRAFWYSLDKTDDDEKTFFSYLVTVLSKARSLSPDEVLPVEDEQDLVTGKKVMPYLINILKDLPEDTYLVLDDYHSITSPGIHEPMTRFIEYLPPKMHVIILSRYALPLPTARVKVRGSMTEIDSGDMKLSRKETERLFADVFDIQLSPGQLQEVTRQMEGWMGGLQLLALLIKGKKSFSSITDALCRADRMSRPYLIDEVVDIQPEKVKTFLEATALLDRFTVDLCAAVTNLPDVHELLDFALRNNLFLASLDHGQKWFRYHHLFSAAVRARCLTTRLEFYKNTHKRAAKWFIGQHLVEDAFRHAFASGDLDFAAEMIEDHLEFFLNECNIVFFRRWFYKLPREAIASRAFLMLLEVHHKIDGTDFTSAVRILKDIEMRKAELPARYPEPKRKLCRDLIKIFIELLPYLGNHLDADVELFRKTAEQIPAKYEALRRNVLRTVPLIYFQQGEYSLAKEALEGMYTKVFSMGRMQEYMACLGVSAHIERITGHLSQAMAIAKKSLSILEQKPSFNDSLKFIPEIHLAWISYLRNDLQRAMFYLSPSLKGSEQYLLLYSLLDVLLLASLISTARGEHDKTDRWIRKLERCSEKFATATAVAYVNAHIARLHVMRGNMEPAEEWMRGKHIDTKQFPRFHLVMEWLAYTEVLCGLGRYQEALQAAEMARARCYEHQMMKAVLDLDIIRAASLWALKQYSKATAVMNEALQFGSGEYFIRPFANHGKMIVPVLADISGRPLRIKDSSYFAAVKKACNISDGNEGANGARMEQLTRTEVEVLKLLADGLKDKEIAEKLFISIATVRTHTTHIFRKLDVNTRVQATRCANTLGYF